MATTTKRRWGGGRRGPAPVMRVLTASSMRLDLLSKPQARRTRALRQGWQLEAWAYRDSVPELRYAVEFLANCASRMRIFPAAYPEGGETDAPIPLRDAGAPQELIDACDAAMADLGNGRLAMARVMKDLSSNLSVAGEGYLLGQEDPETLAQTWSIRSIDEILVYDDKYKLREVPMDPQGILGWIDLDPAHTVVTRIWRPHPRFRILADSPLRAMIDDLESLIILRRGIRATGRSRLASRGLLLVPDELELPVPDEDPDDPEATAFGGQLTKAIIAPINDEGVASAVAPIIIKGPADLLDKVRFVEFTGKFDELAGATREELIGIAAIGFDLPKEIWTGIADLNHWSAWSVDDNTWRSHVEPHVLVAVDCLTTAFLRPYLDDAGLSQATVEEWRNRTLLWYDPVELVTKPDQSANAQQAHLALAISDEAYRTALGFSDEDAPSPGEIEVRMIRTTRTWPPNVIMGLLHELDPTLTIPPMTGPPAIPGISPGGVVDPINLTGPADAGAGTDDAGAGDAGATEPAPVAAPPLQGPPPMGSEGDVVAAARAILRAEITEAERGALVRALRVSLERSLGYDPFGDAPLVGAARDPSRPTAEQLRLARRLARIDRDLRTHLRTAASAAVVRALEKAGARLRNRVSRDERTRLQIAHTRNAEVGGVLGLDRIVAAGYTPATLLSSEAWDDFRADFYSSTGQAQAEALKNAAQLAGLALDSEAVNQAQAALAQGTDAGWELMAQALTTIFQHLSYNPALPGGEVGDFNPQTVVPTGVVRAALGVSGGADVQDFGTIAMADGATVPAVSLGVPVGGVATGATLQGLITGPGGKAIIGYEWTHGPGIRPFEPHEALDGIEFVSFVDPALLNPGDWPPVEYFLPGDHDGCGCDAIPQFADGGPSTAEIDQLAPPPDLSEPEVIPPEAAAPPAPVPIAATPESPPEPPASVPLEPGPRTTPGYVDRPPTIETDQFGRPVPLPEGVMSDAEATRAFQPEEFQTLSEPNPNYTAHEQLGEDMAIQKGPATEALRSGSYFAPAPKGAFTGSLSLDQTRSLENYQGFEYQLTNGFLRDPERLAEDLQEVMGEQMADMLGDEGLADIAEASGMDWASMSEQEKYELLDDSKQEMFGELFAEKQTELEEQIANMRGALAGQMLKRDAVLFRGVGDDLEEIFGPLHVGDTFGDPGFLSTSLSRGVARHGFAGGDQLVISAKAGTHAIGIPGTSLHEGEVLFPDDTELLVQRVEQEGDHRVWWVSVVPRG